MARTKRANSDDPAEDLWDIPNGWKWTALAEVGRWGSGGTPKANDIRFYDGPIPWVRSGELDKGRIQSTEKTLTELGLENSSAKWVPEQSLLVALYGANIGQTAMTGIRCTTNQAVAFCVPNETADVSYLFRYVEFIKSRLCELGQGGAQPNISQAILRAHPIPLPSIQTQHRIASRIDELFAEIDDGERAHADARAGLYTYRKSLLHAAVTGELTADWRATSKSGESAHAFLERLLTKPLSPIANCPFALPNSWTWILLGDLLSGIEAGLNVKSEGRSPENEEPGVVKVSAVTWDEYDESESKTLPASFAPNARALIRVGDFLISRANTLELVGAPAIVRTTNKRLFLSDKVLRLLLPDCLKEWLYFVLKSPFGRSQIESRSTGNQLSMRNIPQSGIRTIPVPVPSKEEVLYLCAGLRESWDMSGTFKEHGWLRSGSVALRQSILSAAFRGELVS